MGVSICSLPIPASGLGTIVAERMIKAAGWAGVIQKANFAAVTWALHRGTHSSCGCLPKIKPLYNVNNDGEGAQELPPLT